MSVRIARRFDCALSYRLIVVLTTRGLYFMELLSKLYIICISGCESMDYSECSSAAEVEKSMGHTNG